MAEPRSYIRKPTPAIFWNGWSDWDAEEIIMWLSAHGASSATRAENQEYISIFKNGVRVDAGPDTWIICEAGRFQTLSEWEFEDTFFTE